MRVLPSTYVFGIIIFTFFILGGMALISPLRAADPTFLDDDKYAQFNKTFNKVDDVTDSVGGLQDTIEDSDTDFGTFGVLNALISTAWNSLKLVFSSFSFMNAVFGGLYTFFGIPIWVGNLIILMVSVMIIFAIFAAIFQRQI